MNIRLSGEQYEKLLHLAYLGNWVVNAYRGSEAKPEYDEAAELIYAHAAEAGLKSLVDFDEAEGRYFPSARLEDELAELIDDYDDWAFWDLLILKLAERDLVRQAGQEAVDAMDDKELEERRAPYVKKYEKEVENNGILDLEIIRVS
jgi:hypothetical protein